jgi:hypothetical protein
MTAVDQGGFRRFCVITLLAGAGLLASYIPAAVPCGNHIVELRHE